MNWFESQRLQWIAETLRVFGYINRAHIERKFGVSTPQASNDLRKFAQLYPELIVYNINTKRYEARPDLQSEGKTPYRIRRKGARNDPSKTQTPRRSAREGDRENHRR
ncbi:MAG: hypothetical protein J2P48_17585 [Alphaproteobacteria bacterium]|nr:hypothetical protein [Alphaproteobacteria bacterium]